MTEYIYKEAQETLEWIENWRTGMYDPAPARDGWTVEMHGLVDSTEQLAKFIVTFSEINDEIQEWVSLKGFLVPNDLIKLLSDLDWATRNTQGKNEETS